MAVFGRSIVGDELNMATGEALAHLNYLKHRGELALSASESGVTLYNPSHVAQPGE